MAQRSALSPSHTPHNVLASRCHISYPSITSHMESQNTALVSVRIERSDTGAFHPHLACHPTSDNPRSRHASHIPSNPLPRRPHLTPLITSRISSNTRQTLSHPTRPEARVPHLPTPSHTLPIPDMSHLPVSHERPDVHRSGVFDGPLYSAPLQQVEANQRYR